jgi:hypothetical protein
LSEKNTFFCKVTLIGNNITALAIAHKMLKHNFLLQDIFSEIINFIMNKEKFGRKQKEMKNKRSCDIDYLLFYLDFQIIPESAQKIVRY